MALTSSESRLRSVLSLINNAVSRNHPEILQSPPAIQVIHRFEEVPELKKVSGNPAVYQESTGTILVDEAIFFSLDHANQLAVLSHELGEFVCQRFPELTLAVADLNCDLRADYFACTLGFFEETAIGRSDRNAEFHEALRSFKDPAEFVRKIHRWHQRKLAGLAH
jgi:hypothetical protein